MHRRSISGRNLDKAITSDDILGKEVIDSEGEIIGVVEKVLIDPENFDMIGIEIDKGFLKRGLVIGRSYMDRITEYALFLNTKVLYQIKGMSVFDSSGKLIGKVTRVNMVGKRNKIKEIVVSGGFISRAAGRDIIIPAVKIKRIEHNVLLDVKMEDLT